MKAIANRPSKAWPRPAPCRSSGVYPPDFQACPIGMAMNRNPTIRMGNCPHRKHIPKLIELTLAGKIDPAKLLTQSQKMPDALGAFEAFDRRENGWIKVELLPQAGS